DGERAADRLLRRRRPRRLPDRRRECAAAHGAIARLPRRRARAHPGRRATAQAPRGERVRHGAALRDRRAPRSLRRADRIDGRDTLMLRNMAYASASAASAALLLVLFIVAGRTLGDVEFGKFSFALALGTIFETLMDFGLQVVLIRGV